MPGAERAHVLLVEDDEDDVVLVADQLEPYPEFRLVPVSSIAAAIEAMRAHDVRCVLLDLNLPDAVGFDGLERLLEHDPDVAVVVLTGDIDRARGAGAVAAGAQDYLVKGREDGESLVRAIRYAIERRDSARYRLEVALAQAYESENNRLQRGLLPAPILENDSVRVLTAYQPGHRRRLLGGDFYDVVQTPDGMLHAIIGDVAGHGPNEAALGVSLRIAWRTLVLAGTDPEELFPILERVLDHERETDEIFATAAQVDLTADRSRAVVRLAGHPPPVLLQHGSAALLDDCEPGPALGIGGSAPRPHATLRLPEAWSVLLYTDGLFEGRADGTQQRLGLAGLLAVVRQLETTVGDGWLTTLVERVTALNHGPLTDDVAALALTRDASVLPGPRS